MYSILNFFLAHYVSVIKLTSSVIVNERSLQSAVKNACKRNTLCIFKQQILPGITLMLLCSVHIYTQ